MAHKSAIESAGASRVGKAGVFRRLGRPMALAAAALAAALLMASTASAQLTTTTSGTQYWVGTGSGRWLRSGTAVNGNGIYVSGSDTNFADAGTYTFGQLVASGSATLGNITTGSNVNIGFTTSTGQTLNFVGAGGGVGTINAGAGSVIDFGSIATVAGNGITKNGAGTLVLTGGAYTGGFTLNAGNVIARGVSALGTGNIVINGGAIGFVNANNTLNPRDAGKTITVGGNFQIGIADSPASSTANMAFTSTRNGFDLTGSTRTITLGSSGSMTFGQAITNGSLTLNRLSSGAAGQFGLTGSNTISSLTLDSVTVNASSRSNALGAGNVTLQGASATTLNIQSGFLTLANTFTIADSAGTKTITLSGGESTEL